MQFSQAKSRDSVAHMECTLPITAYVSVQHVRYTSTVKAGLSPKNRFPADQDLLQEAPKLAERKNEEWLSDLRTPGLAQETALSDLRSIIRSGLPYALSNYLSPSDPQFDDLAEEVTQDTLLRVLDNLDTFEGRSKFTTWVHKIAVRIALTELRRKRWQDVSLDSLVETEDGQMSISLMADPGVGPELATEQIDILTRVERIILEELTDKQRSALMATRIHGMPMDSVARKMGMNRNALYKLLHDARLRLKRRLTEEGLSPEEALRTFEAG
ncbi:MAG TPA: sigma-70 family RNA polymerase sigma factor [Anaerolineae bacterium]|nr:sigma-70 family RNA polymerase sigma factor [Anaerolineae bacterium]